MRATDADPVYLRGLLRGSVVYGSEHPGSPADRIVITSGKQGKLPIDEAREVLRRYWGYPDFRGGQTKAIESILAGRDTLLIMPTGGGKSLCYQLPGLASADLTIVVSPLIALMSDQVRRLNAEGHPAVMIASGLSEEANRDSLSQIGDGRARIAYCSPERFGATSFLKVISRRRVDLMAIDEAHCLSEWGHDFRPDYLRLPKALERLGRPAVMACTATATEEVAAEIHQRLGMRDPLMVRSGFDRPNLSFDTVTFEGRGSKARKLALLLQQLADPANRPAIVYCGTRRDTDEVAARLRAANIAADGYHAGMQPDERASVQHRFMAGDLDVVTATNAFGMGIDKANVRSVWHWALPTSVEAYYQEAGRAGRDGQPARAVLLAMRSDLGRLIQFIKRREVDPDAVVAYIHNLHARATQADPTPDGRPHLVLDNPRDDAERIRLAVAERAGALVVEPAPGGRIEVVLTGEIDQSRVAGACRVAGDRGWRAYRAIEAYGFGSVCRRRALLDHFGDATPGRPEGRCCDVCAPDNGLPTSEELEQIARSVGRKSGGTGGQASRSSGADAEVELGPDDLALFETLKEWRLRAARGKPAYTVANNATLAAIALRRPADAEALGELRGVGPAFLKRHADTVLSLVDSATEGLSADVDLSRKLAEEEGRAAVIDAYLAGRLSHLGPGAQRLAIREGRGGGDGAEARRRPGSLFAEISAVPAWPLPFTEFDHLAVPVVTITGAESPELLRQAAAQLSAIVPSIGHHQLDEPDPMTGPGLAAVLAATL